MDFPHVMALHLEGMPEHALWIEEPLVQRVNGVAALDPEVAAWCDLTFGPAMWEFEIGEAEYRITDPEKKSKPMLGTMPVYLIHFSGDTDMIAFRLRWF